MYKKTSLFLVAVLLILSNETVSQDFSKSSIKTGFGLGASAGARTDGAGGVISFGYQYQAKEKLRLNSNFSIGSFNSNYIQDARDQHFNSINLEFLAYYDLIRYKAFSLFVGTGGVFNNTRGLLAQGGDNPVPLKSMYISSYNLGFYVGGGLRINPAKSRFAFEILPLNFHVGTNYFTEFYTKIALEIKL